MAKVINCDCGYVVRGETDDELVQQAEQHISEQHPEILFESKQLSLDGDQLIVEGELTVKGITRSVRSAKPW